MTNKRLDYIRNNRNSNTIFLSNKETSFVFQDEYKCSISLFMTSCVTDTDTWSWKHIIGTQGVSKYTVSLNNGYFTKACDLEVTTQFPVVNFEASLVKANVGPPGEFDDFFPTNYEFKLDRPPKIL